MRIYIKRIISILVIFCTFIIFQRITYAESMDKWISDRVIHSTLAIACNKDVFVIVGDDNIIKTSVDGLKWVDRVYPMNVQLNNIIWDGKEFIVFGYDVENYSDSILLYSQNGYKWKQISTVGSMHNDKVIKNGDEIITVGRGGVFSSTDLSNWKAVGKSNIFNSIATNGKDYILVNDGNLLQSGYDLKENKPVKFSCKNLQPYFTNVEWNGNEYLAWGITVMEKRTATGFLYPENHYYIAESKDGTIWSTKEVTEEKSLSVGNSVDFSIKPDIFWVDQKPDQIKNYKQVAWNGKTLVVIYNVYPSGINPWSSIIFAKPAK